MERENPNGLTFILEDNLKKYRNLISENCSPPVTVKKNTVLTTGGSPSPYVYFLLKGIVKISTLNFHGYERILGYHKRNTLFAMDALRRGQNVIVTTTAVTQLTVIKLTIEDLKALFALSSDFATDVVLFYHDVLKLMCYDASSVSGNSVKCKLANFMLLYAQSNDYKRDGFLPFSQNELASAIGASRIQVARVCAHMRDAGVIRIKHKRVYILDHDAVEKTASPMP